MWNCATLTRRALATVQFKRQLVTIFKLITAYMFKDRSPRGIQTFEIQQLT